VTPLTRNPGFDLCHISIAKFGACCLARSHEKTFKKLAANALLCLQVGEEHKFRSAMAAGQLFAAADSRPFAGPALPRLVLRRFRCQFGRHVEAASG
jgi:hypothetical protein